MPILIESHIVQAQVVLFPCTAKLDTVSRPVRAWKTECPCLLWSKAIGDFVGYQLGTADSFEFQIATIYSTVHLQADYCQFPGISTVYTPLLRDNVLIICILPFLIALRVTLSTV